MRPSLRIPFLLTMSVALAPASASATDLFVGGLHTAFARGDSSNGNFTVLGACGGSIQSMAFDGRELFLGDVNGNVYRNTPALFSTSYAFTAGNDAAALAVVGRDLYVGGANGTIERRDTGTNALMSSWSLGVPVTALEVRGPWIYAGSSFGIVMRGSVTSGNFAFWGTCGGPVTSMTADAADLLLGTANGTIYRVALATGTVSSNFQVFSDLSSIAMDGTVLLVASSDGTLQRVDRHTGAHLAALSWQLGIEAMAVGGGLVSTPYCYGTGCPCGNDDPTGGCANSTGVGALLEAIGSSSVTADDFVLAATRMPLSTMGRLYMGPAISHAPFGDGIQCVGGGGYGLFRFPIQSAAGRGAFAFGPGIVNHAETHFGPTGRILAGSTWHFQGWFRNAFGPCGSGFTTTNAASITFTP